MKPAFATLRGCASGKSNEQHFYLRMVQRHFRPGMLWLDTGCGHSLVPAWLPDSKRIEQKFIDDAKLIVGADVGIPSLKRHSRIRRITCPLDALALVIRWLSIYRRRTKPLIPSPVTKVLCEFFRVLRSGGILIILTPISVISRTSCRGSLLPGFTESF